LPGSGRVDLVDPGWLDLDPLDLDLAAVGACGLRGSGARLGPSDHDPTARITRERRPVVAAQQRRRPATNGRGIRWRRTQTRVLVHGWAHRVHLREARRPAERPGAAGAAEMRRGGQASRWRGSRTPVSPLGCHGARARRRTAQVHCSPPGAALGQLHGGDAAATAEK
jgi:hypothetical protein